ncbi:MAG: 16S rRNA (adenine(1518)-N(6)/adenine(1519)-N(6))-dimethyltransferase RsmA [Oscillospiraceae bacterium]
MNLSNPNELKDLLRKHKFSFSKSLGQNFLIDQSTLDEIIEGSGINSDTNVLEIGAGAGTLTRELAHNSKKTVSIEIDKNLVPILNETMSDFENFKLVNQDVMAIDLIALTHEEFGDEPFAVVANLPYYITTPIVMNLLESGANVSGMTLMVQREVATRMAASEGGKDYGALTVAVQFYTNPTIICNAEPHCFIPQPKVASTVINLSVLEKPSVTVSDKKFFFKLVKSAFGQRRKTLVNAISGSPYMEVNKEKVIEALTKMNLDTRIRGERLSLSMFAELSNILFSQIT